MSKSFFGKVALPTAKTPINSGLYKNKPSNFMNHTNSINTNTQTTSELYKNKTSKKENRTTRQTTMAGNI